MLKMRVTVFDPVRKKSVALTPEESVRQQLIEMLNKTLGAPLHLMSCEYSLEAAGKKYRGDLVIFSREAKPVLLAECKAPSVKISKITFEQILKYNMALGVKHILLTNGPDIYFATLNPQTKNYEYKSEIPPYDELSKE